MTSKVDSQRNTHRAKTRSKNYQKLNRRVLENARTERRMCSDMRRYLRSLLRRKGPKNEGEFSLIWAGRPQFHKHTFQEVSVVISRCLPTGWSVSEAATANGDDFTGWQFSLKPTP